MQEAVGGRSGMDRPTDMRAVDLKLERDGQSMLGYLPFEDEDWTGQMMPSRATGTLSKKRWSVKDIFC